jgi:hypothetical protein
MRMDRNEKYTTTFVGHSGIPLQPYLDELQQGKASALIQQEVGHGIGVYSVFF